METLFSLCCYNDPEGIRDCKAIARVANARFSELNFP